MAQGGFKTYSVIGPPVCRHTTQTLPHTDLTLWISGPSPPPFVLTCRATPSLGRKTQCLLSHFVTFVSPLPAFLLSVTPPPLWVSAQVELGARITYQQKFYNTSTAVFCCGATAKRVGQVYVVKAVEPIHLSDNDPTRVCVYALTGLAAGRLPEQIEELKRFHDAYKMFWDRKFLEAEKAFRAYTKEYGYDNVVERLQTLIIQGHTVCESCTKEVAHLSCKQVS